MCRIMMSGQKKTGRNERIWGKGRHIQHSRDVSRWKMEGDGRDTYT